MSQIRTTVRSIIVLFLSALPGISNTLFQTQLYAKTIFSLGIVYVIGEIALSEVKKDEPHIDFTIPLTTGFLGGAVVLLFMRESIFLPLAYAITITILYTIVLFYEKDKKEELRRLGEL